MERNDLRSESPGRSMQGKMELGMSSNPALHKRKEMEPLRPGSPDRALKLTCVGTGMAACCARDPDGSTCLDDQKPSLEKDGG